MIELLIATLKKELDLTAEEIADIFWLTLIRQQASNQPNSSSSNTHSSATTQDTNTNIDTYTGGQQNATENQQIPESDEYKSSQEPPSRNQETKFGLFTRNSSSTQDGNEPLPFKVPNPVVIQNALDIARSLRPLIQIVPSKYKATLDDNKTAQKIAEEKVWQLVTQPILEPWLEIALVVDESTSMLIWQQTILELQKLLKNYGIFRDVRTWGLLVDKNQKIGIRPSFGTMLETQLRSPQELIDPNNRRLILLITDCVSSIWQTGKVLPVLKVWADSSPMAIVQMLPEWLWVRTALKQAEIAHFFALSPGLFNQQLSVIRRFSLEESEAEARRKEVRIPVFCLEPAMILNWSEMVAGKGNLPVPGYIFRLDFQPSAIPLKSTELISQYKPEQLVQRFRVASSPMARRLAGLLAASPTISLPVIRLIQNALLSKKCNQVNVAEVLLGGILKPKETPQPGKNPDEVEYDFIHPKIRSLLLESAPVPDTVQVLSKYIKDKFGIALDQFITDLNWTQSEDEAEVERNRPFAMVTAEVLKRKGGRYSEFVQKIERMFGTVEPDTPQELNNFPLFQSFEFEVATILIKDELIISLQPFEFEVATIELRRKELVITRSRQQAQCFIENLGNGVQLEMVSIPEGSFMMGSPEDEPERSSSESPQHQVTVPAFFIGKYPITQVQWQVVASLPQVNKKLDPDPSRFKGANRPVENISWFAAVEFCDRLSQYTGKTYRLPSEAEWEYVCRAGTTTAFHFGETITTDVVNYRGTDDEEHKHSGSYGRGPKGLYRDETTEVGSFKVANAFGLYDMHGQVSEWCTDNWHDNYEGAPTDGTAWLTDNNSDLRVLRGGGWYDHPKNCRSAYRNFPLLDKYFDYGVRIVCVATFLKTF